MEKPKKPTKSSSADPEPKKRPRRKRRMYFDNPLVESLVVAYQDRGCTDLALRDEIMGHADELIIQVMRTNNLQNIYPYRDQTAEADLFQAAWFEIERSLYKFDASRGTKIFNLWTQVARASMLALIKREGRDRKNKEAYSGHIERQRRPTKSLSRFFEEAREVFKDNLEFIHILDAIERVSEKESKPSERMMARLIEESGLSRAKIQKFLVQVRMRSSEFSDSPMNESPPMRMPDRHGPQQFEDDEE